MFGKNMEIYFSSFNAFLRLVKKCQKTPHRLKKIEDLHVLNRSRCKSIKCIITMIRAYQSYPKYRNEKTVEDIDRTYKTNVPMKMPIILKFDNEMMHCMAGNTRLDLAFINCIEPMVILVPERLRECSF